MAALDTQMEQSGVNLVALGAGRVDWTYFPWPGHLDSWANDVKTSGTDYLLEDSLRFEKWAHVSRFLAKAVEITHKYGKQLFVETFIDEDQNANITGRNGTDISSLLAHADRIVVWGDHNLDEQHAQAALPGFAQFLARYGEKRIIMMIGLWNKSYDAGTPKNAMTSISSDELRTALFLANQRGITNLFITPSFLMSNAHWQVLKDLWGK